MYIDLPLRKFVKELSSDKPYPGGGSAACLVGVLGIALCRMVGGILRNRKKKLTGSQAVALRASLKRLADLEKKALRSIDGDIRTYRKIIRAYSIRKGMPGRAEKIEQALKTGCLYQKDFALLLVQARRLHGFLEKIAEGSISSDLVLSGHFLRASFEGALQTARVNLDYMKADRFKNHQARALSVLEKDFREAGRQ